MRYRVRLSARAERDAEAVLRWLVEQDARTAASRWLSRLLEKIDTLEKFPLRCPLADEADELRIDLRELPFGRGRGRYRILFVVDGRYVHILHIRHAARDRVTQAEI